MSKTLEKQQVEEWVVRVTTAAVILEGNLALPAGAEGLVLFAHGSGSSRFSPRNRLVAQYLQEGGLATSPDQPEAVA